MDVEFEVAVFARHLAAVPQGIEHAQVFVIGNAPELGAWDAKKAVAMKLTEESAAEKTFSTTVSFPAEREYFPLEYKYIIKDAQTNEVVSWEAIPGNRSLTMTRSSNVACGKPAKQSSTYTADCVPSPGDRVASLGTDGNRNGFYEWRIARTKREANPWWTVDLGASVPLETLNLWKATTYHEQPKPSALKPPASALNGASRSSMVPAPPVWVFVSTEDLSAKSGADLIKLAKASGYLPDTIRAFQLELHEDRRVETVSLGGVNGRYVNIQYESEASTLQFAEVEVFAKNTEKPSTSLKLVDGFYGVDAAVDGALQEYVDSEWVDPQGDRSLVRVWVGSFQKEKPAIQWFDGSSNTKPIHVAMRHRVKSQNGSEPQPELPVDSRGASLLDKDCAELRQGLAALLHERRDLKPYLNSTGMATVDDWLQHFYTTHLLDEAQATQMKAQIKTRTFKDGEALLQYGEQARTAYFITKGEINVCGPATVTGVEVLGTVSSNAGINDLGLFSSWPERSATLIAKGTVEAHVVTFESFKRTLGEPKLRRLRDQLLRERNTLHPSSSMSNVLTKQVLFVDEDHAQVFRIKVPTQELSTGEGSRARRLELEFYEATEVGSSIASNRERGHLIGVAPLLLSQIDDHGEGLLTVPIVSKGEGDESVSVVGQVSLHYLVVRPFVHDKNSLASVWRSYWRERPPLNGGHRGMGRHFNQVGGFRKALTRENTLASFLLAGNSGADFVEFDVQLTKDHVPVLYHDFILRVGLEDKRVWTQGAKAEQHEIAIHRMSLRELGRSQTSAVPRKEMPILKRLVKKHWHAILGRPVKVNTADPKRGNVGDSALDDEHLVDFYPLLEDLLKHVPPEIGLNIEIKYPDRFKRSNYRFSPSFAMNYYVDKILQCVFDHAGSPTRRIFFSCFDPDLVVLLRAKQATFPVFFLTYGRVQPTIDARLSLQFAINFVKMEKLRGIVSNSDEFLTNPACVELVKRTGAVLMTWGDQNTSHECVQLQKRHAIDGVISDNIGDLTREDAKKGSEGRQ